MRQALLIAAKDLKLRIRDRSAIIAAFIAPFALASIISLAFGGNNDSFHPTYLVVDNDGGLVGQSFKAVTTALKDDFTFQDVATEGAARKMIEDGKASGGFVFVSGSSDAFVAGGPANIQILRTPDAQISGDIAEAIATGYAAQLNAGRLSIATAIASGTDPTPQQIARLSQAVTTERLPIELAAVSGATRELPPASYFGPSMAIFFLFFTVQFGPRSILSERREGTLQRLAASPIRPMTIVFGKSIASFVLGLTSLGTLLLAISLVFGAPLGNPLALAAICVAIVIAAMGLTALMISMTHSEQQADSLGSILTMGLALLGGNFIPINQAPELFRKLSLLTPNGWALRSFNDLLTVGGGFATILPGLAAMLAFGLVAGSIAVLRAKRMVIA
ncbi:MAG: ABC transporter permease [Actinomycetota bacterium]